MLPAPEVQLKNQVLFFDNKVDQGKESDFEFPTREILEESKRPESVSLKTIQVDFNCNVQVKSLSGISMTLSNDEESCKISAQTGDSELRSKVYQIDANRKIAKVGLARKKNLTCGISAIYFYDKNGAELFSYCPGGSYHKKFGDSLYEEQEVPEGEELIGFHGIKNNKQFLPKIGLVTKSIKTL